jgi:hypothetical protein
MTKLGSFAWIAAACLVASPAVADPPANGLLRARAGFRTQAAPSSFRAAGPASAPPPGPFELVRYRAPVGDLAAYLTRDPGDGKHPAVLWAHGGFGGIGEAELAWVEPLAQTGIVVMCPSWRGENDNPGRYEMFYGEVDDALAALDHLAGLPYVDPARLYVVGHNTGGTLAMLIAEAPSRARAVFALGGPTNVERVVAEGAYSTASPPFPVKRAGEAVFRSPNYFISTIRTPTFYFEGLRTSVYAADANLMAVTARMVGVPFSAQTIAGGNNATIVTPLLGLIARKILADSASFAPDEAQEAFGASRPEVSLRYGGVDFEMALRVSGADVCTVVPAGDKRTEDCAGLDPAASRGVIANAGPVVTASVIRFDGWNATAVVTRTLGNIDFSTQKARDDIGRGLVQGALTVAPGNRVYGDAPGSDYAVVTVAGRPAIKVTMELALPPGMAKNDVDRLLMYVVPTEGAFLAILFGANHEHFDSLRRLAEASVATVKVLPPKPAEVHDPHADVRDSSLGLNKVWSSLRWFLILSGMAVAGAIRKAHERSSRRSGPP